MCICTDIEFCIEISNTEVAAVHVPGTCTRTSFEFHVCIEGKLE